MKISKIGAVAAAAALSIGMCTPSAFAADVVRLGEMIHTTDGTTATVSVPVNYAPSGAGATLVAAYVNPTTGEILSLGTDVSEDISQEAELTASLADESLTGELRYYVLDSLSGRVPLKNSAPTAPTDADGESLGYKEIALSWGDADDGQDESADMKYNVYNEGMIILENVTEKSAIITDLERGTDYSFEMKAVDTDGAESKIGAEASAKTEDIVTVKTTTELINDSQNRLQFSGTIGSGENYNICVKTTAGGLDCLKTVTTNGGRNTFFNYKFSPDYLAEIEDERDFVFELEYFDDGTSPVRMVYYCWENSADNNQQPTVALFNKTDTNTWKVFRGRLTIPEKFIENPDAGNANMNFRIQESTYNDGLKVRSFSVMPASEYDQNDAYFKANEAQLTCGMNTPMATAEMTEKDGRNAVLANSTAFSVTDSAVSDGAGYVEISYFAENDGTEIALDGTEKEISASGKWQKMRFDLDIIGSGEHTITASSDIYIHSVRVVAPIA